MCLEPFAILNTQYGRKVAQRHSTEGGRIMERERGGGETRIRLRRMKNEKGIK